VVGKSSIGINAGFIPRGIGLQEKPCKRIIKTGPQINEARLKIEVLSMKQEWLIQSRSAEELRRRYGGILKERCSGCRGELKGDSRPYQGVVPFIIERTRQYAEHQITGK